jgi:hypothetical protein
LIVRRTIRSKAPGCFPIIARGGRLKLVRTSHWLSVRRIPQVNRQTRERRISDHNTFFAESSQLNLDMKITNPAKFQPLTQPVLSAWPDALISQKHDDIISGNGTRK